MDPRSNLSAFSGFKAQFGEPQFLCESKNSTPGQDKNQSESYMTPQNVEEPLVVHLMNQVLGRIKIGEWLRILKDYTSTEVPHVNSTGGNTTDSLSDGSLNATDKRFYQELTLEALDERWQIYLVILYSLTALTSFILNVLTVVVLIRNHRCMLRRYIINLSLSDLLMSLLSIPFTYTEYMLGRWVFPGFLCPVVRSAVLLSVFVSAVTMTAIGINRYMGIMYPMKRTRKNMKIRHLRVNETHLIISIWIVGLAISTPEFLMHSCEPFCFKNVLYHDCRTTWPDYIKDSYSVFVYLCTFAVPVLLLSYVYTRMGVELWRHRTPGNRDVNRDLTLHTTRVKVIKMFFVVVALFVVSWLPIQTFPMVNMIFPGIREVHFKSLAYNIYVGSYFTFHWLSMFHSCLNPLIYCFMSGKFRRALYHLIFRRRSNLARARRYTLTNRSGHDNYNQHARGSDNHLGVSFVNDSPSRIEGPLARKAREHGVVGDQVRSPKPGGASSNAHPEHPVGRGEGKRHLNATERAGKLVRNQAASRKLSSGLSETLHRSATLLHSSQPSPGGRQSRGPTDAPVGAEKDTHRAEVSGQQLEAIQMGRLEESPTVGCEGAEDGLVDESECSAEEDRV